MLDLDAWLESCLQALKAAFGDRLWFVGLQGSRGRGEATENSDIDTVVILDALTKEDIAAYGAVLDTLEHRDLVCGFLSGRAELLCWEPSDLFQFCHDTTPILGSLDTILAKVDADAVDRAVRMGACNLYHGCVHNLLFERDEKALPGLYKAAAFVIRALVFRQTGRFCRRLDELSDHAGEEEKKIIAAYVQMTHGGAGDFQGLSESLFGWAQRIITLPTYVRNTF